MTKIAQLSAAALALTFAFGTAQAGSLNDDIKNCRAAIEEAELLGGAEFNLDFVSDKGKRSRVITLEARVVGGDNQTIECRMTRSKINEVVVIEG
ncbi:hypothetical protein HK107_04075 [Parvularcula sp. ZS-1/3]|uniref:Uncharacterized protein n=1 Tax=Parvularcula mediterranea TaxID=2732508 RepID=A0A7Y3RK01_9PROT|nr:hypothetical protein [Parvularcula mediterranea]NNU15497.1 hypothetical protein [Parvularcula mediterranea]